MKKHLTEEYTGVWVIKLTAQELETARNLARDYWINTNAEKQVPGTGKQMTEHQLTALAWMNACLGVLAGRGLGPVQITLDTPDLEPDTEP